MYALLTGPAFVPIIAMLVMLLSIATVFFSMRTKRFYFIRHGETVLNAKHLRQGPEGALSERGRMQAKNVSEYLKRFPIKRIITSSYPRAEETAGILAAGLKVPVIVSELFRERKNPSEIIGKRADDPEVVAIVDRIELAYHADDFRYSEEENFLDLKARAQKALNLLARQGVDGTAIVTHHAFLKMLIAYMLYRDQLHAGDFVKLSYFNVSDNAGVTVCEYHPWERFSATHGWHVISFNEQP